MSRSSANAFVAAVICCGLGATGALHAEDTSIKPFRIDVSDAALANLQQRLAQTRLPATPPTDDWGYGVSMAYMQELLDYWRKEYDWRRWEARLNRFDQYTTRIDGVELHFVHQRSLHAEATPLLLIHGWPGSFVAFHKLIEPLTEPEKHGGQPSDAFHVVVPSLPGFGFSSAPKESGWNTYRMAGALAKLMERLGYERYGAQGGDFGAGMVQWLGIHDAEHVIGVHTNHPGFAAGLMPPEPVRWEGVSAEERKRWEQRRAELRRQTAYGAIQGTRPQTIGFALNDSPAGLAAWIVDKFWAWSDHGGDLDSVFSKDDLITNIMIYWISESAPTSARIYFERGKGLGDPQASNVPIGAALFPKEIHQTPRRWFERRYGARVIQYTIMPRGGHFAALETPELLLLDIRAFFAKIR